MTSDVATLPDPLQSRFEHEGNALLSFTWPAPGRPRVLLVHGIGMGHWVYADFIEALREHSAADTGEPFEVVAVDLPGFGDCPVPQEAQSIAHTADLIALALAHHFASATFIVVGHSMGAQVAAELAARHPDIVDHLVLVGTTVNPKERSARQQAFRMVQDLGNANMSVLTKGLVAYAKTGLRWFIEKLEPTIEHRIEDTLPHITRPTLVLRGSDDPVSPRDWSQRVAALVPGASYAEIADRGHEAIISDGEPAVLEIMAWLGLERPNPRG